MKTTLILLILICAPFSIIGCDVEPKEKAGEVPKKEISRHVKCWSGGTVIYEGDSIGSAIREDNYVWFTDRADGRRKSISGDCILEYTTK